MSSPPSPLAPDHGVRRLRLPRRGLLALLGLAVVVASVVLVVADPFAGGGNTGGVIDNAFPTGVASVTRRSLSSQTQVNATLGYAGTSTIVAPAGTAPSDVLKARQMVATDKSTLRANESTLAADNEVLSQLRASLTAARAKQAVDCAGVNAAQAASSGGASNSGGSSSGACASDVQAVSTYEQSLTSALAKVAGDETQVSAARRSLGGDEASLTVAESAAAVTGQNSTYTRLPAIGQIIRRGQSLYAISGVPVLLLYGAVSAWRPFVPGMSAGHDVAELNANLRALGYGRGLEGNAYTAATGAAIKGFQAAHGLARNGRLLLGSVVFKPGAVRVTSVTPTVGAAMQAGTVLAITSTVRQVTIALDAGQQGGVKVGDPVTITLPNNRTTSGKVTHVGTVATTPSNSDGGGGGGGSDAPTIEVDVTPSDPAATGRLDQAPVNVSITTASVENALVVPVAALLALGSGGYALEEIGAGGAHRLVAVTVGLFDDALGLVQVSGAGLADGRRIVVPST